MGAASISWLGKGEFDAALDRMVEKAHAAAEAALRSAGEAVVNEAHASFGSGGGPRTGSGRLADAIGMTNPAVDGFGYTASVGPMGVVYARRVELGKHSPHGAMAHPYLKPGFSRAKPKIEEIFIAAWTAATR